MTGHIELEFSKQVFEFSLRDMEPMAGNTIASGQVQFDPRSAIVEIKDGSMVFVKIYGTTADDEPVKLFYDNVGGTGRLIHEAPGWLRRLVNTSMGLGLIDAAGSIHAGQQLEETSGTSPGQDESSGQ